MAFGSYEAGVLQRTPLPKVNAADEWALRDYTREYIQRKQVWDASNEVSHLFVVPTLIRSVEETLIGRAAKWNTDVAASWCKINELQAQIDTIVYHGYGICKGDRDELEQGLQGKVRVEEDIVNHDDGTDEE
jgi:hypothetical protein